MTDLTTEQIVEAGARAMYEGRPVPGITWELLKRGVKVEYRRDAQAAYDAMLPLIRKQLADEVRGDCAPEILGVHEDYGEEVWCPKCRKHWPCANEATARLIEEGL